MPSQYDTLDAIPALAPDREEIERRNVSRGKHPKRSAARPRHSKAVLLLVLLCLLAVAGLGGWNYLLYQQWLVAAEQQEQAVARLQLLEKRLMNTDESMSESSDVFQVRLKELDSEVRKLWDNVWKKAKVRLAEQDKSIKTLRAQAATIEQQAADLTQALAAAQLSLKVVEDQLEASHGVADDVAAISGRLAAQKQQVAKVEKALQGLQQDDAETERRLQETEEWVASFNGYRTQINRKLLDLQGSIRALQSP